MKKNLILLLLLSIIFSCKKGDRASDLPSAELVTEEPCNCGAGTPGMTGEVIELKDPQGKVQARMVKKEDVYVVGGDMILSEKQFQAVKHDIEHPAKEVIYEDRGLKPALQDAKTLHRLEELRTRLPKGDEVQVQRTFNTNAFQLWPNRTVPYVINPGVTNPQRVIDAINHWSSKTNIKLIKRTNQANYVEFFPARPGGLCTSMVGMVGGRQAITVSDYCDASILTHEIGHAIGFLHEQERSDRERYIKILYDNILPENRIWFNTYLPNTGFEIGAFDFQSVMLYHSWSFSKDPQNYYLYTITDLSGRPFSDAKVLSAGDVETYNYLYNAPFAYNNYYLNKPDNYFKDERFENWRHYGNSVIEFYADRERTKPYILPHQVKIRILRTRTTLISGTEKEYRNVTLPAGKSSYDIGDYYYGAYLEYSKFTWWEHIQHYAEPGVGYNLVGTIK
jgi:hypothetical protein